MRYGRSRCTCSSCACGSTTVTGRSTACSGRLQSKCSSTWSFRRLRGRRAATPLRRSWASRSSPTPIESPCTARTMSCTSSTSCPESWTSSRPECSSRGRTAASSRAFRLQRLAATRGPCFRLQASPVSTRPSKRRMGSFNPSGRRHGLRGGVQDSRPRSAARPSARCWPSRLGNGRSQIRCSSSCRWFHTISTCGTRPSRTRCWIGTSQTGMLRTPTAMLPGAWRSQSSRRLLLSPLRRS